MLLKLKKMLGFASFSQAKLYLSLSLYQLDFLSSFRLYWSLIDTLSLSETTAELFYILFDFLC